MNSEKSLTELIRGRGYHLTRQRRLVFEILDESQEHLDADTLYARARARDPKISLATVYRSLAMLKETGLVVENRLGENHGHFETMQESPHFHFTCQKCGRVLELPAGPVLEAIQKVCSLHHLRVDEVSLHLNGLCPDCR